MTSKTTFFKLYLTQVDPNFPATPEAQIYAKHDGIYQSMTPKMTESELDGYIDFLHEELEKIRQEGKQKFAEAKNKLRR